MLVVQGWPSITPLIYFTYQEKRNRLFHHCKNKMRTKLTKVVDEMSFSHTTAKCKIMPILQNEERLAALGEEVVDCTLYAEEVLGEQKEMVAECHRKLGGNHDIIPCIKRINLNYSNMPLHTEVSDTGRAW